MRLGLQFALLGLLPLLAADNVEIEVRPSRVRQQEDRQARIRVDSNLVLIPVSVTDRVNKPILGLGRDQFRIFEDKHEQTITHFSMEDSPVSVAIVFDTSGSMQATLKRSREMLRELIKAAHPEDEFALVRVKDRPEWMSDFCRDADELDRLLAFEAPQGRTSLFDGVYLALNGLKKARHSRKAIIVISDGDDNHSRYTGSELASAVLESDVQIYWAGVFPSGANQFTDGFMEIDSDARVLLSRLTEETGGRSYAVESAKKMPEVAAKIGTALHSQYLLAYSSSNPPIDGKYRRVKVELVNPPVRKPRIAARLGYFSAGR